MTMWSMKAAAPRPADGQPAVGQQIQVLVGDYLCSPAPSS
jgi:hypothetical protein